jgi:hypothetical protein
MLVKIDCQTCKTPHFDHYACSECQYNLGFVNPHINYCPNCGGKLTKRATDLRQLQLKKSQSATKILAHKIGFRNGASR